MLAICAAPSSSVRAESRRPLALLAPASQPGGKALRLELSARSLRYRPCAAGVDRRSCRATLELAGKVTLRSQTASARQSVAPLSLEAEALDVVLDARGRPLSFLARGGVQLRLGRRRGQAREVRLDARQRLIVLTGSPRLFCPELGLRLRGKRIAVELETGRLSVDDVQAALELRRGQR